MKTNNFMGFLEFFLLAYAQNIYLLALRSHLLYPLILGDAFFTPLHPAGGKGGDEPSASHSQGVHQRPALRLRAALHMYGSQREVRPPGIPMFARHVFQRELAQGFEPSAGRSPNCSAACKLCDGGLQPQAQSPHGRYILKAFAFWR